MHSFSQGVSLLKNPPEDLSPVSCLLIGNGFLVPTTCKIDRSAFIWLHSYLGKKEESSIAAESEFISNI